MKTNKPITKLKDLKANSVRIVNMDKVKIADLSKDNLQGE